jgi:O-antigen/teichoic acid export membrane protein
MTGSFFLANQVKAVWRGDGLTSRIIRSSIFTVGGFGFSQAMRLLSNLLLTRILFPEAFGLMALVTTLIVGLAMFSDAGISPAIQQSKHGDDTEFLNTAFTIQVIRGVILFLVGCALAYPVSVFYGEDILFPMIMVVSLQFIVTGFTPTRLETGNRHLLVGRIAVLDIVSQTTALFVMLAFALWTRSVWALIFGGLFGAVVRVVLFSIFLPGERNHLTWDKQAVHEFLHFGKWIFLSTAFGFFLAQGDRLVLGKFLALDDFGIYVIGFFLGSFPLMLGNVINARLLIPVYRDRPPSASRENFLKLRRLRVLITSSVFLLLGLLAFSGPWLVTLMYDDRYLPAGAIVVILACIGLPSAIGMTYDSAALAAGRSRDFCFLSFFGAAMRLIGLLVGVSVGGLVGALIGQLCGTLATYPALVWVSVRVKVWDVMHDAVFALLGSLIAVTAIWWSWAEITTLSAG